MAKSKKRLFVPSSPSCPLQPISHVYPSLVHEFGLCQVSYMASRYTLNFMKTLESLFAVALEYSLINEKVNSLDGLEDILF